MGKLLQWQPQLIGEFFARAAETTRWIVPGFVAYEGLTLISGPRKLGMKTWLADMLALVITENMTVDALRCTDPGPVLYFEEEGTPLGTRLRWQGFERTFGLDIAKSENLYYAFRPRVLLDDMEWRRKIMAAVEAIKPKAVIFDALTYMHSANENQTHEMRPVVDTLQDIRACGTACVFLAHCNSRGSEERTLDIDLGVRGSKVVLDAYDVHVALRRYAVDEDIQCRIRQREGSEMFYELSWDLHSEWNEEIEAEEVLSVRPHFRSEEDADVGKSMENLLVQLDFGKGYPVRAIARKAKMRRERCQALLNRLLASCQIEATNDKGNINYRRVK